ncbi:MAG: M20/M25/M40 family metallo-hydrolase [Chloroflexi bacterium]|nr:M20/M25/M40 family metallo-hydrolase [Chloroflexota bacterium]
MNTLLAAAESVRSAVVATCQRLVQTPSLSGEEGAVAAAIRDQMQALGYDEVASDEVGNVVGLMRGTGGGPSLELNGHMDVVDPGDPAAWPYPPYGGEVHDGAIWGRGASDMKGSLASIVHGVALLRQLGIRTAGDIYVAAAVMEETGGLGTIHLTGHLRPGAAVVGEASDGALARGHRGRYEIVVRVKGRSVHASVPQQGANPHYTMATFIGRLAELRLGSDPFLGPASLAPTLYLTDQRSGNVIPGECSLHLDWRDVPGDSPDALLAQIRALLAECLRDGCTGEAELLVYEARTYTGLVTSMASAFPSFILPAGHPLLARAGAALERTFGARPPVIGWSFATDGGHLMKSGIPVIGYSPAQPDFAHTVEDRIEIDALVRGVAGYAALAQALTQEA